MLSPRVSGVPIKAGAALVLCLVVLLAAFAQAQSWEMSVCADPNTMPFSHQNETGFENRIAEILADELDASLNYVWWPQGQTMISGKLREGECDMVMGIPDGQYELLSTVAYYRSPHVFVYRADAPFDISSLDDEDLLNLRIGVQHTGIAPHEALLSRGLAGNVVFEGGEQGYGDEGAHRLDPIVEAVANGTVDVALAWGPVAGYYAARQDMKMKIVPVTPVIEPPFRSMVLSMTIGMRPGDEALRDRLNSALSVRWDEIQQILSEYGVPRSPLPRPVAAIPRDATGGETPVRVGLVIPTLSTGETIGASLFDLIGEAAGMGAQLAEDDLAVKGGSSGRQVSLELILASSPSPGAAARAGGRLAGIEQVDALIGGLGRNQARELAKVAGEYEILFFNIGSPSSELRRSCNRHTFHIEPSSAMYIDALVEWFSRQGHERWFVVHEDTEQGETLALTAQETIEELAGESEIVGRAGVVPGQPSYLLELDNARDSQADVILLLLRAEDQIPFLAQQHSVGPDVAVAPFPDPVTQTRNYMAAVTSLSGTSTLTYRVHPWETTLDSGDAGELNERYISRWGQPMDSSAWAAYQAMAILYRAVAETGEPEARALIDYLESPEAEFDLAKGSDVSFRPWDHQLRQPLYVVEIDPEAPWRRQVTQQLAIARLSEVLYGEGETGDGKHLQYLDRLGTERHSSDCGWQESAAE